MTVIIDANVLIKAYIPENQSEKAEEIFNDAVKGRLFLIAPDLIFPETGNILWKKHRLDELTEIEVKEISREILSLPLKIEPSKPLINLAIELSLLYDITVYDALYFSLALSYDTKLITADMKLVNKLKTSEHKQYIEWLGEYVCKKSS